MISAGSSSLASLSGSSPPRASRSTQPRGAWEAVGRADDDVGRRVGQDVLELAAAELRVDGDERVPVAIAATAATQVSSVDSAHTATRSAPSNCFGERGGRLAQLAVGQPAVADRDGRLPVQLVPRQQLPAHEAGG